MTSPNDIIPPGSAQTGSGDAAGFAAFAAKTGDQWKAEANGQFASSYEGPFGFLGKLVTNMLGGFANGITGLVSSLFSGLTGLSGGSLLDLVGSLVGIKSQAQLAKEASDSAASQAQGALTAAQAADRKITALLTGGVRTVYTSNATWTKPAGLIKLGVLLYGGGRRGTNASWVGAGGAGGGVIFFEFTADQLPDSVPITIGAGSSGPGVTSNTTFGNLLSSSDSGGGQLQNSTLLALASSIFPGAGGASGNGQGSGGNAIAGQPGGSTALASGGAPGQAGGNAPVTGQYLAGGGGGGGGSSSGGLFGPMTNGGAGGFPGGGGGGAGRNSNETYTVGGFGAPGLCALIEFRAAA